MRARLAASQAVALLAVLCATPKGRVEGAPPDGGARDEPRRRCPFRAGAHVQESLGVDRAMRAAIPLTHVVVLMQENRSFDHYFGRLWMAGQPEAEGFPPDFTNPDADGRPVAPFHLPSTCFPRDPPHQWSAARSQWNHGRMDGFVTSADDDDGDGRWAMGYYDATDLPFYHWLAATFSLGDRHFAAALGGTWPNRQFLYAGASQTPRSKTGVLTGTRTLFDLLDRARVAWRVYTDGPPRQDCIGWKKGARGVEGSAAFLSALRTGSLPPVSFLDASVEDEHPPADVQRGERWARSIYAELLRSPLWPRLVVFLTYDEGGGFFDHVAPPTACPPDGGRMDLQRRGTRVPIIALSAWARPHHVSHAVSDHASILRFIELLHDLPALSARDANADALLDLFDFSTPRLLIPPVAPPAGTNGCRRVAVARR